jgi:Nuclease-related domain
VLHSPRQPSVLGAIRRRLFFNRSYSRRESRRRWSNHMRIVRDTGYIKRRKRIARATAIGGFVLLGSTFIVAFNQRLILYAYMLLFVGFLLFNYGMQQMGKWNRNPRNDSLLDSRLQPFSDKYVLIHYAKLGRDVVEHLLVHPGGVLVLTARELPGVVYGRGNKWRKRGVGISRFFSFSGPQLGNPSSDTDRAIAAVETFLAVRQMEVDVHGAIVFLNAAVELDVTEPDFPVLLSDELPGFVSSLEEDKSFTQAERDSLVSELGAGLEVEQTVTTRTRRPVKVKRRAA